MHFRLLFWIFVVCLLLPMFPSKAEDVQWPKPGRYVFDRDSPIQRDTARFIGALFMMHEEKTSNHVSVVVLHTLDGLSIEEYAKELVRHWEHDQEAYKNAVVLAIMNETGNAAIGVGSGLSDTLTDELARTIIDEHVVPKFHRDGIAEAVSTGAREIVNVLSGGTVGEEYEDWRSFSLPWAVAMIVAGIILRMSLAIYRRGWTDYDRLARNYSPERQRDAIWGGGGADFGTPGVHIVASDNSGGDIDRTEREWADPETRPTHGAERKDST